MQPPALTRWISPGITRKFVFINFLLFVLAIVLTVMSTVAITIVSGLRAYVAGEGLYAKYQKDASFYLRRYVTDGNEADYAKFAADIRVPLGDGNARRALARPWADRDEAARGFRQAKNSEYDIPALIKLYVYFHHFSAMENAINIWARADDLVTQLAQTGATAHQRMTSAHFSARDRRDLIVRIVRDREIEQVHLLDYFSELTATPCQGQLQGRDCHREAAAARRRSALDVRLGQRQLRSRLLQPSLVQLARSIS